MTTYTRILATVLVVALVVIAGALVVGAKQSSDTAKQVETLQKSVLKLQKSVDISSAKTLSGVQRVNNLVYGSCVLLGFDRFTRVYPGGGYWPWGC